MKLIEDVCIIVQARLSSERVPGKMLKPFAHSTLMDILIKKLLTSSIIPKENIFLSVHEDELKSLGHKYNINIFPRSLKSSKSEGEEITDIYEWHDKLPFKYVILISACNPLLSIQTIDTFINKFINSDKEGMFAVFEKKTYYWNSIGNSITDWKGSKIMNTKYVDPIYEAAHCMYGSRMDIIKDGYWMDTKNPPEPELYIMDQLESFDIDYEWQFIVGELLYKQFYDEKN